MKKSATNKIIEYMRQEALKPESAFKMPTMKQLTKQFKVSLVTVTRAVKVLEAEGVIVCRHGSGIVAARQSCTNANFKSSYDSGKGKCIVLAVIDYPSDVIWNRTYMVEQYARQNGYVVINCKIHQDTKPADIIDFVRHQENCAGLILMPSIMRFTDDEVKSFEQLSMPVVFVHGMFDYMALPENIYMVDKNPNESGMLAAKHLYEHGHRNIGLIRNEPATEYTEIFIKTVSDFLKRAEEKAQLHYFPSIIRNWGNSKEEARRITRENIANIHLKNITALIYLSSEGAFAALPILKSAGFRMPQDISIIAQTDSWVCEYSQPAITTVATDCKSMCLRAVKIISDEKYRDEQCFRVKERIIKRDSVVNNKILNKQQGAYITA